MIDCLSWTPEKVATPLPVKYSGRCRICLLMPYLPGTRFHDVFRIVQYTIVGSMKEELAGMWKEVEVKYSG